MKCSVRGELWKYEGAAGWCFVTLSKALSAKIRKGHAEAEEGWGRLKAQVTIGKTSWKTSIWFDTKRDAYLLPVKTQIRKTEKLAIGSKIAATIEIHDDNILG